MANAGDVFELTPHERLRVVRSTADTGGEVLEVEATYEPGGKPPPAHHHPAQEERFEVVSGELRAVIAGEQRTLRAGEVLEIPPGVAHKMHNAGSQPAIVRWQVRPALRTERLWEEIAALGGDVSPLRMGPILQRHRDEFRLEIPEIVQRPLVAALGTAGRLLR